MIIKRTIFILLGSIFLFVGSSASAGDSVSAKDCSYGGKIKSIEATGDLEVTFTMCKPDPAFRAKAAFTPFSVQPKEYLDSTGGGGSILENPIGTGPWKLEKWNRGDSIIYTRFEDYWGKKPSFDKLVVSGRADVLVY